MKDKIRVLLLERRLKQAGKLVAELVKDNDYLEKRNNKLWKDRLDATNEIRTQLNVLRNDIIALEIKKETS